MIGISRGVSRDLEKEKAGRMHHGFALFYLHLLEGKLSIEVGEVYAWCEGYSLTRRHFFSSSHASWLDPILPWKYARTLAIMSSAASFGPGGSSFGSGCFG